MADVHNLKDAMIELLRSEFANKPAIVCTVVKVNGNKVTVKAVVTERTYKDVRLQAHPGNGVLLIPTTGSYVILEWISDTAGYIAMHSSLDSIQLLDGSHGGLIKISELVDKLNVLEQRMTSHQHLTGASAGALTGYDVTTNPDITETTVSDLENPDITHGSK
jgi:hypothetical protein